jgi:hypothetical protein
MIALHLSALHANATKKGWIDAHVKSTMSGLLFFMPGI